MPEDDALRCSDSYGESAGLVVFDLDGTLVDSAAEIVSAFEQAWSQVVRSEPFPRQVIRIGPPLTRIITGLAESSGASELRDPDTKEELAARFRAIYDASDFELTVPYEGVKEMLDELKVRGALLALATNKRKAPTQRIVTKYFPTCFTWVACIDGVTKGDRDCAVVPGSKQAMLEWLANESRLERGRIVMIGDTVDDVAAARACALRSVAVTWGYEASDLLAAGAHSIAHDVGELRAMMTTWLDRPR